MDMVREELREAGAGPRQAFDMLWFGLLVSLCSPLLLGLWLIGWLLGWAVSGSAAARCG